MCSIAVAISALAAGPIRAGTVCPDSSYVTVTLGPSGKDRLTIDPHPSGGETWKQHGITIRVFLKSCEGNPLAGIPAEEIVLDAPSLCFCPGGNIADAPTDIDGSTSFSGALNGGGCTEELTVVATGIPIGRTGLKTNSQDAVPVSPCYVDAGDLAALAARLGCPGPSCRGQYSICFDWNEDGFIDASDGAHYAWNLGANHCP